MNVMLTTKIPRSANPRRASTSCTHVLTVGGFVVVRLIMESSFPHKVYYVKYMLCRMGSCSLEDRMNDVAVPDFFRRLWRLPTVEHRLGRKSALDVETVVSTAVRLADEGGLDAATLPKVAAELSVSAMSLYRHIGSKHELLQLMMDAASEPGRSEEHTSELQSRGHL